MELGKPLDGAREFEAAEKIKPGDDGIETNLALAYFQAGEAAKAIPHFESAAEPVAAARTRSARGVVLRRLWSRAGRTGKPDQAALQFVAEEALTGPRADLEDAIGTLDAQQANWQEAQQRFEHAISLDSSYVRARIHLGMLFRAQKDLVDALNTLSRQPL